MSLEHTDGSAADYGDLALLLLRGHVELVCCSVYECEMVLLRAAGEGEKLLANV